MQFKHLCSKLVLILISVGVAYGQFPDAPGLFGHTWAAFGDTGMAGDMVVLQGINCQSPITAVPYPNPILPPFGSPVAVPPCAIASSNFTDQQSLNYSSPAPGECGTICGTSIASYSAVTGLKTSVTIASPSGCDQAGTSSAVFYRQNLSAPVGPGGKLTLWFHVTGTAAKYGFVGFGVLLVSDDIAHPVLLSPSFNLASVDQNFTTPPLTIGPSGKYTILLTASVSQEVNGTASITVNTSCDLDPPNVVISLGNADSSFSHQPVSMNASYTPTVNGTAIPLKDAAFRCNFQGFDWQQTITSWPLASQVGMPTPPFPDPPQGGYGYMRNSDLSWNLNANPFFFDRDKVLSEEQKPTGFLFGDTPIVSPDGMTLRFQDAPANQCLRNNLPNLVGQLLKYHCFPGTSGFMAFTTALVGINKDGTPSQPLYQWSWTSTFNGVSGGVSRTMNPAVDIDAGSGSGGIGPISIDTTPVTPPAVTCAASPAVLWPPSGNTVQVTVSGQITLGTQGITLGGATWSAVDEYGQIQPSGTITANNTGAYSFTVPLIAARNESDSNGRIYAINVNASDSIGNMAACSATVTVPHGNASTFSDTTFNLSDYSVVRYQSDVTASVAVAQTASGGNPGSALEIQYSIPADPSFDSTLVFINPSFTYNPVVQGPIQTVDASLDRYLKLSGPVTANTFRPAILQDGNYYEAVINGPLVGGVFNSIAQTGLRATDFGQFDFKLGAVDTTRHPNFAGGVMQFGLAARYFTNFSPTPSASAADIRYDNLRITINPFAPVTVSPPGGGGSSQNFTFTFTDWSGWQDLKVVDVLINTALDGRHACYIAFTPSGANSGSLFLVDDAGDAGGPYQGMQLPGSGSVSNSQCSITGAGSTVSGAGSNLTLTLSITFTPAFSGNKAIYLSEQTLSLVSSGWSALGTWGVPGATASGPSADVAATTTSGGPQTLTVSFSDPGGYQNLSVVNILINNALDGRHACYLAFAPSSASGGSIYLVDDAGDAGGPYQGLVLPSSGTISNSQCTISASGSSVTGDGNNLVVSMQLNFGAAFSGPRIVYAAARDTGGASSGWQTLATLNP